jgi:hypothetical protein
MSLRRTTTFTIHALDRVAERMHLSRIELAAILDHGRAVTLGVDEYSNRLHRLFFSRVDEQFFVAVQDTKTGDVITVLPLKYYANLHGYVKEDQVVEAAALLGYPPPDVRKMPGVMPKPEPGINTRATVIRIAGVLRRDDGRPTIKNLGSWPSDRAPLQLVDLVHQAGFLSEMRCRAREKGVELSPPFELRFQMGNNGEPVCVEIERWPEAWPDNRDVLRSSDTQSV